MRDLKTRIQSPTYHYTKIQNRLYGEISNYIETTEGMNGTKLAEKLGVTKGYVSQLINNGADHKLSKLIKLSLAIGKIPTLNFVEPDMFLENELEKRKERQPLDLEELNNHMCDLHSIIEIRKEEHSNDFASAKPYSQF